MRGWSVQPQPAGDHSGGVAAYSRSDDDEKREEAQECQAASWNEWPKKSIAVS
ncbi:hypothetical protein PV350_44170 [Streptomyces sp. PA03-6a]|nr:hypothetical protein [Streptomyces sp. PA03-6a]